MFPCQHPGLHYDLEAISDFVFIYQERLGLRVLFSNPTNLNLETFALDSALKVKNAFRSLLFLCFRLKCFIFLFKLHHEVPLRYRGNVGKKMSPNMEHVTNLGVTLLLFSAWSFQVHLVCTHSSSETFFLLPATQHLR